jgi:hypothetical protein
MYIQQCRVKNRTTNSFLIDKYFMYIASVTTSSIFLFERQTCLALASHNDRSSAITASQIRWPLKKKACESKLPNSEEE